MSKSGLTLLSVEVCFHEDAIERLYLDELEDRVCGLADDKEGVVAGVSSAQESGEGSWTEVYSVEVMKSDLVDPLVEEIVAVVRELGVPKGYVVNLSKRLLGEEDELESHRKRIHRKRDTKWRLDESSSTLTSLKPQVESLPSRIDYLQEDVQRYYLAGGHDFTAIFRRRSEVETFVANLSRSARSRLERIYDRLVANEDHKWIMAWAMDNENEEVPTEKDQAVYFLGFLDRLREEGIIKCAEVQELVDWDLLSSGE